jgi:hypothetical protein
MTFLLLVLVAGGAWAVYEFAYVRRVFAGGGGGPPELDHKTRDRVREAVIAYLEEDECFAEMGAISYRYKENCWRVDVVLRDGCDDEVQGIARRVSGMLRDRLGVSVAVWCSDRAGRELGHVLP